MDDIDKKILSL